jgi:hypothetical protein
MILTIIAGEEGGWSKYCPCRGPCKTKEGSIIERLESITSRFATQQAGMQ